MKNFFLTSILFFALNSSFAQTKQANIKQMVWGPDYQVYLKLDNDSGYSYAIDQLFHANPEIAFDRNSEFIYFPVTFEQSYIDSIIESNIEPELIVEKPSGPRIRRLTLWNSLNESIGGGWAHFINCLAFVLETHQLELTAPLLCRPENRWKPNPVTDTYKRTKKWKYFVPVTQKQAQREYKIRLKRNQLGDLKSIPSSYTDLLLNTSEREYQKMIVKGDYKSVAKIDLVKLMLGSPYLGEEQILYIKNRVLTSIDMYYKKRVPSILIFDTYEAAVAMTLDGLGYKASKIVFKNQEMLSEDEIKHRSLIINGIIALINESNTKAFKNRLDEMYKQK